MSPQPNRSLPVDALPQDDTIVRPDGSLLALRIYAQADRRDGTPLVLHFHAGAFVGGGLADGATVAGLLADAGASVVSVDYPLAPAHPFPQAVEAGYDALLWVERNRRRLAATRSPIYVAGEEAGGNLAAAVAMVARDRAGPALAGQILLSPMLDACIATASQRDAKAGPVGCRWADGWRAYMAREDDALHPYAAPGQSMRLVELPRTLLVSASDDPLRDETQAFHHRLQSAGVPVELSLLEVKTGWPLSYQRGPASPWAAPLGERLREFLSTVPVSNPRGSHP
jgi:acetyl esterase